MSEKRMLIIAASEDIEEAEIANIKSQVELYGIKVDIAPVNSNSEVTDALSKGSKFDYIYLATHGCADNWFSKSGKVNMTWVAFADQVCTYDVLNEGAIFLHSCCRGGLEKVAMDMFACCENISLVCGPRYNVKSRDLVMAFNLFLYNIEVKGIDPIVSAFKVLSAIDVRLHCTDRVECFYTPQYASHCSLVNRMREEANAQEQQSQQLLDTPDGYVPPEVLALRNTAQA